VKTRREFLVAGGAGLCALAPLASFAQEKGKVWRIGFFYNGARQSAIDTGRYPAFLQGMRELGYIEGKNFVIEARFAEAGEVHPSGRQSRQPQLFPSSCRPPVSTRSNSGSWQASLGQVATSRA
jgi:hypothetical protein